MSNEKQLSITDMQNIGAEVEKLAREQSHIDQIVGISRMAEYFEKLAVLANIKAIKEIKETKQYMGYMHHMGDGNWRKIASWDDFCELVLKKSRRTIDERLQSLDRLGEDFIENANALGLKQTLINDVSRLSQDERQVIIEVVQQSDATKEQVIEAFERMMEKNAIAKQKLEQANAELTAKLEDVAGDLESSRKLSAEKTKHLDEAREQLERAQRKRFEADPVDIGEELKLGMGKYEAEALSAVVKMGQFCEELIAHGQAHGMDHTPAMVGSINQIIRAAESLRETFALPREAPMDAVPAWIKDAD